MEHELLFNKVIRDKAACVWSALPESKGERPEDEQIVAAHNLVYNSLFEDEQTVWDFHLTGMYPSEIAICMDMTESDVEGIISRTGGYIIANITKLRRCA